MNYEEKQDGGIFHREGAKGAKSRIWILNSFASLASSRWKCILFLRLLPFS
jgi:hypothetical protein